MSWSILSSAASPYPAGRRPSSGWLSDIPMNRKCSLPATTWITISDYFVGGRQPVHKRQTHMAAVDTQSDHVKEDPRFPVAQASPSHAMSGRHLFGLKSTRHSTMGSHRVQTGGGTAPRQATRQSWLPPPNSRRYRLAVPHLWPRNSCPTPPRST
jgi:hypothetical protein